MSTQPMQGSGWIPDDREFSARLALIRWKKRWNQKEAALACGFPYSTWRRWEEGSYPHNLVEVASQIADRTGVDMYWLLTGDTRQSPRPGRLSDQDGGTPNGGGLPRLDSNQQPSGPGLHLVAGPARRASTAGAETYPRRLRLVTTEAEAS